MNGVITCATAITATVEMGKTVNVRLRLNFMIFNKQFLAVLDANEGSLLIGRGMSIIQRSTKLDVPGKQVYKIILSSAKNLYFLSLWLSLIKWLSTWRLIV